MMYLHMRILNPDIEPKNCSAFLKQSSNEVKKIILKYAKHIQKTLIKIN